MRKIFLAALIAAVFLFAFGLPASAGSTSSVTVYLPLVQSSTPADINEIAFGYYWNEEGAFYTFLENLGTLPRYLTVKVWTPDLGTSVFWFGLVWPGPENLVALDLSGYGHLSLSLWEWGEELGNIDSEPAYGLPNIELGIFPVFGSNGIETYYLSRDGISERIETPDRCEGTLESSGKEVYVWYRSRAEGCP